MFIFVLFIFIFNFLIFCFIYFIFEIAYSVEYLSPLLTFSTPEEIKKTKNNTQKQYNTEFLKKYEGK